MQKLTSPLKWAGGKRWLVPSIRPVWAKYQANRLVEPFCGGISIALGLMPKEALLNDINSHLINFYNWVKVGLTISNNLENSSTAYYSYREEFNRLISNGKDRSQRAAELFFYLNKTCFNGLCRFNADGKFNVPFGRHEIINYNLDFSVYQNIFAQWNFSNKSYKHLEFEKNDFIFADPPYDVEFRKYSKDGFEWEEQEYLAKLLSSHLGPVILCNHATDRIVALYKSLDYKLNYLQERIYIKANGDRTPANVVIATKNIDEPIGQFGDGSSGQKVGGGTRLNERNHVLGGKKPAKPGT